MENFEEQNILNSVKPTGNNLQVPDQYFENLPSKIANRIHTSKPAFSLHRRVFWTLGLSISILALFLIVLKPNSETQSVELADETQQIAMVWDQSYAEDVFNSETKELEEMITNSTSQINSSDEETLLVNISDDEIEEYLYQEINVKELDALPDIE